MSTLTDDQKFTIYMNDIRIKLLYYSNLTILPVGIILNTVSSFIFLRKKFSNTTMGFYNIIMALVNNALIILGMIAYFSQALGNDYLLISNFSCLFLSYNLRLFSQMSSWLNVFITVDRMVSITYPNKYPFLKNKTKLTLLILMMFALLGVLNIPNLFYKVDTVISYNSATNKTTITKYCTSSELVVRARDTIILVFRMALPIILMVFMNIYLILKLLKVRGKFKSKRDLTKEYYFALSIFGMNVLYVISLTPNFVSVIYLNTIQYDQTAVVGTKKFAVAQFFFAVSVVISTYNIFLVFFVNLAFNKIFRLECLYLFNLLIRVFNKSYDGRITNSTINSASAKNNSTSRK